MGGRSPGHTAKAFSTSDPTAFLQQIAEEGKKRAEEVAQHLQDATKTASLPNLESFQNLVPPNAADLPQHLMPAFSALLFLARSPGSPLTAEQEAKFSQVLPP